MSSPGESGVCSSCCCQARRIARRSTEVSRIASSSAGDQNLKLQDGSSDGNQVVIGVVGADHTKYPNPTGGYGWVCTSAGAFNLPDYLLGETLGVELVGFRLSGSSHSMVSYYIGNDKKRYNVFRIFEPFYLADFWDTDGDSYIFKSMGQGLKAGFGSWERL